jgi:hypothetical protein
LVPTVGGAGGGGRRKAAKETKGEKKGAIKEGRKEGRSEGTRRKKGKREDRTIGRKAVKCEKGWDEMERQWTEVERRKEATRSLWSLGQHARLHARPSTRESSSERKRGEGGSNGDVIIGSGRRKGREERRKEGRKE